MEQELKALLLQKGASLAGIADLTGLPQDDTDGYPRAVAIAVALTPQIVARIPTGPHKEYSDEYVNRNTQLDGLGLLAEAELRRRGHRAHAVTRDRAPYGPPNFRTTLPYKTVARLAGFGWIGKCATLVTEAYGNALRLTMVLTDAPLAPDAPLGESRCGACPACQNACPGKAVKGPEYSLKGLDKLEVTEARARVFDAGACHALLGGRAEQYPGWSATCGMCIAVCPYTRKYLKRVGAV